MSTLPLVAILRGVRPDEVVGIADALMAAGFTLIEVPLNSPDPFDSIARLVDHCPDDVVVGAGTVLSVADAERLGTIGARLMVTPIIDPEVVRAATDAGIATAIGCMTPGEVFTAINAGATAVKIFPANALPIRYAADLKAVMPRRCPVLAVGGVGAGDFAAYTAGGYDGFGLGSSLYAPGLAADEVGARAAAVVAAWRQVEGS
ncbi:MAG: 2-dehydro-3-deoxy-6-phosphogalactonate aldolase [Hyphomicrobiales bacterium]|nr:MAG: 2-dehydro-3-deoxy-6-phosphogalactonate aldolase [Hyphomicrobiales bacterium]